LLGVERFALYDTAHPGVFGAAEIDELIDKMKGESGEGELAPTIEELKAHVGTANSDLGGLDERGEIRKEKIAGFERWIDQGVAKIHWMNFGSEAWSLSTGWRGILSADATWPAQMLEKREIRTPPCSSIASTTSARLPNGSRNSMWMSSCPWHRPTVPRTRLLPNRAP
jgi:hypothetical protein